MQKNDIFEIEITGMTDDGSGVGRAEGIAVFVPYAILGETARVIIIKIMKNYAVGKLLEVLKPSTEREKSDCKFFYQCGGCALRHMSYKEELRFKHQKVSDCFTRIGGFDKLIINNIVPAKSRQRYRNKSQFPITPDGIGMYANHSHRLIEIDDCLISHPSSKKITAAVRYWIKTYSVLPYDEKTGRGVIRNLYTRYGKNGAIVCIVTASSKLPHSDELVSELKKCGANVCGIIQNINTKNTNVVLGKETKTLWGDSELIDNIGHVEFYISPLSFYQVNKSQTEKLYTIAREFADLKGCETVWDMYCGIGTIGQFMADKCKKIIGVEVVPEAVENAVRNAKHNGIENAEYHCGKAENIIADLVKHGEAPDVVVLDPPRKGCDKRLIDILSSIRDLKKIVYISCKPSTLARDAKIFAENGFEIKSVTPVDMFPGTPHVECVTLLQKSNRKSKPDTYVKLNLDMEYYYRIMDA